MRLFQRPLPFVVLLAIAAVGFAFAGPHTVQSQAACPGFDTQLTVGVEGYVLPGPPNNVRSAPTVSAAEVGQIPAGGTFSVLEGPICGDGFTWWRVQAEGITGWTAAGNATGRYLLPVEPVLTPLSGGAQPGTPAQGREGQSNVAFILDASGSMQADLPDGERRITAARRALGELSTNIPAGVNASLWVFGHRIGNSEAERTQSCRDIEQLISLGPMDAAEFTSQANSVTARGWTPLTDAISQAAATLPPASDNSIVLISDGEATCGGDPCAVAAALADSNIDLVVNTIGFDVDAATREQLQCIARVTEGQYFDASNANELGSALQQAAVQPTVIPASPTPVPTTPAMAMFRAVNNAGEVQEDVRFFLNDFRTTDYTGMGTVQVPPGNYSGGLYVPLPQGNEQFLSRTQWPGEGEIEPGAIIDINIDDYFGERVTFQAADAQGNLLPNAQIEVLPPFCAEDILGTYTGTATRYRTISGSQRLCFRITVNGETFVPGPRGPSAADVSVSRDVSENLATLTAFDGVVIFSDRATPPGFGVVQGVTPDGERLAGRQWDFRAGGNDGTKISQRPGTDIRYTRIYLEEGTYTFTRNNGQQRQDLGTYDIVPGEELQLILETGERFGATAAADAATADPNTIFFDDFEQEGVDDLVRNYGAWSNWDVVTGTVDAINGARIQNANASYGVMVDLDGSTRESGVFTTKQQFELMPGDYVLSFDATSSRLEGDNTFRVMVGDVLSEQVTVTTDQPVETYRFTFTVTQAATAGVTFDHTLTPGDNNGAYIDNVRLVRAGTMTGSTNTGATAIPTAAPATAFPTPAQTPGTPPSTGTGELLTFGLAIEGNLASAETDLWAFIGSEGQIIDIIVDGSTLSGTGDVLFTLAGPDGSLLITSDDNDMAGTLMLNPGLDGYALPASGNYTIQLRALDPSTTGTYTIEVREG
jgi:hypothetical protein